MHTGKLFLLPSSYIAHIIEFWRCWCWARNARREWSTAARNCGRPPHRPSFIIWIKIKLFYHHARSTPMNCPPSSKITSNSDHTHNTNIHTIPSVPSVSKSYRQMLMSSHISHQYSASLTSPTRPVCSKKKETVLTLFYRKWHMRNYQQSTP